jgi:hypothetical protein
MVPLIEEVLGEMGIEARALLMLRGPGEIARSLAARDGTTPDFARLLWLRHTIDAERATRRMRRAVVDYDTMLLDWRCGRSRRSPAARGWHPTKRRPRRSTSSSIPTCAITATRPDTMMTGWR